MDKCQAAIGPQWWTESPVEICVVLCFQRALRCIIEVFLCVGSRKGEENIVDESYRCGCALNVEKDSLGRHDEAQVTRSNIRVGPNSPPDEEGTPERSEGGEVIRLNH